MEPPFRLEYSVSADALGDADEGSDEHHGDADPLDFLGQRSSATRASASSGGKNRRLHTLRFHITGHFLPYP